MRDRPRQSADRRDDGQRRRGTGGRSDEAISLERAVSPVVGTVMMVALTLLLASTIVAVLASTGEELDETEEAIGEIGPETATGNPWAGNLGDLVQVSNDEAGASGVRVRINFTVEPGSDTIGNSLNSVKVDVQTDSPDMFSGTGQGDIEKAVVDTDGDGAGEENVESRLDGWQVSNGGSTVKIEFSDPVYTVQEDDSVVIVFGNVDNPPTAKTYDVRVQTSGDGNWQSGTITVE